MALPYVPVDVLLRMVPTFFDVLEIYTTISPVCKTWCFYSLHLARESAILAFLEDWPQVPRQAIDKLPHDVVSELRRYMRVHVALLQPQRGLWRFPEGWCEQMAQDMGYREEGVVELVRLNHATPTGTLLSPALTAAWLECLLTCNSIPTTLLSNIRKHVEAQEKREHGVYTTTWEWLRRMYRWIMYVHPHSQNYVSMSMLANNPLSVTFDYVFMQLVRGILKHTHMTEHPGMQGLASSIYAATSSLWNGAPDPTHEGWMWAQEIHMLAHWAGATVPPFTRNR